ncbi:MAG TPA: MinD/ParA family protein, partial [Caldilineaceae bacterium]|nr:MinD/ParA family protein [Caldilineaceae bacterium]
ISIHSFRGGTGKSNTTANVSTVLAQGGAKVAVIDTDIQSPGIHNLFQIKEENFGYSLNDYLWGKCSMREATHDVTHTIGPNPQHGKLYLVPSSIKSDEIARILRDGYDPSLLNEGFGELLDTFELDYLLIDTHPGLNEETLLSIAISDVLAIIMRPDTQDYQGTGVTVEVAQKLGIERLQLVVNKVPLTYDLDLVKQDMERTYNCEVAMVFPHSDDLMALASAGTFVVHYPDHPITQKYRELTANLIQQ